MKNNKRRGDFEDEVSRPRKKRVSSSPSPSPTDTPTLVFCDYSPPSPVGSPSPSSNSLREITITRELLMLKQSDTAKKLGMKVSQDYP